MKTIAKLAFSGLMLAGAALATTAPASAGVSVNIGLPGIGIAVGNPCAGPFAYRPAYCGYPVYGEPIFIDGGWYNGPVYYREFGGERYFWIHNGWMRDRVEFHPGRAYRPVAWRR
jgi:hypothetical protein